MRIELDFDSSAGIVIPAAAAECAARATGVAVRLLILLAADPGYRDDFDTYASELEKKLKCTRRELDMALAFWCGAGVMKLESAGYTAEQGADTTENVVNKSDKGGMVATHAAKPVRATKTENTKKTNHTNAGTEQDSEPKLHETTTPGKRGSRLIRAAGIPEYTSEELADMLETNIGALAFVDESQRRIGKMLNSREISILIGLRGYLELDDEYLYILFDYCAKIEKTSMRYIETMAFGLYDEGITDAEALGVRLAEREASRQLEGRFKEMIGARGRRLTAKETRFLNRWSSEMKYEFDMIEKAYEITVDTKHEYNPAYMNGIFERWFAADIKTLEQVEAERDKKKRPIEFGNSFDTDEFFEAALRRSFRE